jgi:hypothetical protein
MEIWKTCCISFLATLAASVLVSFLFHVFSLPEYIRFVLVLWLARRDPPPEKRSVTNTSRCGN